VTTRVIAAFGRKWIPVECFFALIVSTAACTPSLLEQQMAQACAQYKIDPRNAAQEVYDRPYYLCMKGVLPEDIDAVIAGDGWTAVKGIKLQSLLAIMGEPTSSSDAGGGNYRLSWSDYSGGVTRSVNVTVLNYVVTEIDRNTIR
jgi:hypothetical protein